MARALVLCSSAGGTAEEQSQAQQRRSTARTLLQHAAPLVEAATKEGLADLKWLGEKNRMEKVLTRSVSAKFEGEEE